MYCIANRPTIVCKVDVTSQGTERAAVVAVAVGGRVNVGPSAVNGAVDGVPSHVVHLTVARLAALEHRAVVVDKEEVRGGHLVKRTTKGVDPERAVTRSVARRPWFDSLRVDDIADGDVTRNTLVIAKLCKDAERTR